MTSASCPTGSRYQFLSGVVMQRGPALTVWVGHGCDTGFTLELVLISPCVFGCLTITLGYHHRVRRLFLLRPRHNWLRPSELERFIPSQTFLILTQHLHQGIAWSKLPKDVFCLFLIYLHFCLPLLGCFLGFRPSFFSFGLLVCIFGLFSTVKFDIHILHSMYHFRIAIAKYRLLTWYRGHSMVLLKYVTMDAMGDLFSWNISSLYRLWRRGTGNEMHQV